jgi:hypothetical protein
MWALAPEVCLLGIFGETWFFRSRFIRVLSKQINPSQRRVFIQVLKDPGELQKGEEDENRIRFY